MIGKGALSVCRGARCAERPGVRSNGLEKTVECSECQRAAQRVLKRAARGGVCAAAVWVGESNLRVLSVVARVARSAPACVLMASEGG